MKSKKRFATSRERPEAMTFFVDRSLGRIAGQILRDAGANVEFHDDHFPEDAPDVDWLPVVGANGWAVLTKDKQIRFRRLELQAVLAANLRVYVLASSKGLTGNQIGEMFARNLARMERLGRKYQPPFIAGVYPNQVRLYDLPAK
jgi:hypothetical protein